MLKPWDALPYCMKNKYVKSYYDLLKRKRYQLLIKLIFDFSASLTLLVFLLPAMLLIMLIIKLDSEGPALFRQKRITQYGNKFRIYKFRTMINEAEKNGSQVTTFNDSRVTRIGRVLRKMRIDELPQLFNILVGDMSFVGTRPEVPKYVDSYAEEMMATLLLPAGVTSTASINYKDEERLLLKSSDAEKTYTKKIIPEKMTYNLEDVRNFSFLLDIKILIKTLYAIIRINR